MLVVSYPIFPYQPALELQEKIHSLRKQNRMEDCLLLLEHPPTITIGKNGDAQNVLFSKERLHDLGVQVHQIGRGGDVTYHGPGQLVGYPILDIRNYSKGVKEFIHTVEEVFIHWLLDQYQIHARHDSEYTGVWVGDQKITAIGFQISRFITMHGFAFNLNTDLNHFKWINPCGIVDKGVTSLQQLTGQEQSRVIAEKNIIQWFEELFRTTCESLSPEEFMHYIQQKELSI